MAIKPPTLIRPNILPSVSAPVVSKVISRPVTLPRRSTLKRSIADTSLLDVPSSPSKRARVTFSEDTDILSGDDADDLDPALIKEQVRRAVERHFVRDDESYDQLQTLFTTHYERDNAPSTRVLKYHLIALESIVSRLSKQCAGLVHAVLSSEWVGRSDSYVLLFTRFLGNLASAQGGYLDSIIDMLVNFLGKQRTRRVPGERVTRQARIHKTVYSALRHITDVVPIASSALVQKMAQKLDFEFKKGSHRMTFVRSFMTLTQHVPVVTSDVLNAVMRELIKLDSAIQTELDNDDNDILEEQILQHMSNSQTLLYHEKRRMSQESTASEDDSAVSSDESDLSDEEIDDDDQSLEAREKREELKQQKLKDDVQQVDMIMDILFAYYSEAGRTMSLERRDAIFEGIIAQFNNLILPTYRSRHPQFLVFHFAQADPARVDRFVTNCTGILLDSNYPPISRHAAAAFLSGFVGRGAHVSPRLVVDCMDLICSQLDRLRERYSPRCQGPDLKRFGDFYAIFQAAMYIFCFRWREIGDSIYDEDDSDMEGEERAYQLPHQMHAALHAAIYSKLNPLRVCSPGIVEQFAELTMRLKVLYVYPKLEENKRIRSLGSWQSISDLNISTPQTDMSWMGENGMLEGYFPYDPYQLPLSKHWLDGDYVEWQGVGDEEADSDAESDDDYDRLEEYDVDVSDADSM